MQFEYSHMISIIITCNHKNDSFLVVHIGIKESMTDANVSIHTDWCNGPHGTRTGSYAHHANDRTQCGMVVEVPT